MVIHEEEAFGFENSYDNEQTIFAEAIKVKEAREASVELIAWHTS